MLRLAPPFLLLALLVTGCGPTGPDPVAAPPDSAPQPPTTDVQSEAFWIDVRSPEEYAEGHLDDAINIPHDQIADRIEAVLADRSRPIAVYCRSGRRAGVARETLLGLGYRTVRNAGGYEALRGK